MRLFPSLALATALTASVIALVAVTGSASAGGCDESGGASDSAIAIGMTCVDPGASGPSGPTAIDDGEAAQSPYIQYKWVSVCHSVGAPVSSGGALDCGQARTCPDSVERLWRLWGKKQSGQWDPLGTQCFGKPPTTAQTPKPQVTPGLVLAAIRRIGLPALEAQTQPAGKTLVNFATIFYAEPQPFVRTIRLLGQRVDVEATPSQYAWHHGDGTTATTSTPGAPYPATDITYDYTDAHITVRPSVDVTYTARFRVGGGRWQDIPDTVTIAGPVGSLRISEATAVLSGQHP
jgi:hypothetical protein